MKIIRMLAISFLFCLSGTLAFAFTHEDLYPFLEVQLPGYTADELDGFEAGGSIIAARDYFKEETRILFLAFPLSWDKRLMFLQLYFPTKALRGRSIFIRPAFKGLKLM